MPKAVRDIVTGKTFDNGVLCSSPNSVVVDAPVVGGGQAASSSTNGGYFLSPAESDAVGERAASRRSGCRIPKLVGRPATVHRAAGRHHRARRHAGAHRGAEGRRPRLSRCRSRSSAPSSRSTSSSDWREGCERCIADPALRRHGPHHVDPLAQRQTSSCEFGLKKPAFRIVVNTPTTHGSIGLTTGLDPAMTLGCGGWGGNITSDNISPRHLLNIKRLAYETNPAVVRPAAPAGARRAGVAPEDPACRSLPRPPAVPGGIAADVAGAADRRVPGVARLSAAPVRPGCQAAPAAPSACAPAARQRRAPRAPSAARPEPSRSRPSSYAKTTSGRPASRIARS